MGEGARGHLVKMLFFAEVVLQVMGKNFIFSLLLLSLKGKMVNIPFLYDGLK